MLVKAVYHVERQFFYSSIKLHADCIAIRACANPASRVLSVPHVPARFVSSRIIPLLSTNRTKNTRCPFRVWLYWDVIETHVSINVLISPNSGCKLQLFRTLKYEVLFWIKVDYEHHLKRYLAYMILCIEQITFLLETRGHVSHVFILNFLQGFT